MLIKVSPARTVYVYVVGVGRLICGSGGMTVGVRVGVPVW
jgi:hypothetical protein